MVLAWLPHLPLRRCIGSFLLVTLAASVVGLLYSALLIHSVRRDWVVAHTHHKFRNIPESGVDPFRDEKNGGNDPLAAVPLPEAPDKLLWSPSPCVSHGNFTMQPGMDDAVCDISVRPLAKIRGCGRRANNGEIRDGYLHMNCPGKASYRVDSWYGRSGANGLRNFGIEDSVDESWHKLNTSRVYVGDAMAVVARCGTDMPVDNVLFEVRPDENVLTRANKHAVPTEPLNVAVIFLDSCARSTAISTMTNTMEFLKKLNSTNIASTYNFPFYQSYATSTRRFLRSAFGNIDPKDDGGVIQCLEKLGVRVLPWMCPAVPWLWDVFSRHGYATGWVDGFCDNSALRDIQPFTDHPFQDVFCKRKRSQYRPRNALEQYNVNVENGNPVCVANERQTKMLFRNGGQFWNAYREIPRMLVVDPSEGHSRQVHGCQLIDEDLHWFLEKITPDLDNTLLVIVGDHGLDENNPLPFLSISAPDHFLDRHPFARESLQRNQYRLVTPLDLYRTVTHLLDYPRLYSPKSDFGANVAGLTLKTAEVKRGQVPKSSLSYSLFNPVPKSRTCADAHVPPELCASTRWQELAADAPVTDAPRVSAGYVHVVTASDVVDMVYRGFNLVIEGFPACMQLKNRRILKWARFKNWYRLKTETTFGTVYVVHLVLRGAPTQNPTVEMFEITRVRQITTYTPHLFCQPEGADPNYCFCDSSQVKD